MVRLVTALVLSSLLLCGCSRGPKPPKREPTFPVSGTVHIDGKPAEFVRVNMYPAAKEVLDPKLGAPHTGITDKDGKFEIRTYDQNDGAPAGDYKFGFYWEGPPAKVIPLQNPDEPVLDPAAVRFNNKYLYPGPNAPTGKVESGQATDLGVFELKTK